MSWSRLTTHVVCRCESVRRFSSSTHLQNKHSCKLLIVGGGAGGCTIASKFASKLKQHELIVVEPSDQHYYQPMFTLVGGGTKSIANTRRPMATVLPRNSTWLKDAVSEFSPECSTVRTRNGDSITYDYLLVAMGLQLNYESIPGLLDALSQEGSGVCSNYSPQFVGKTFDCLRAFRKGNAIFTLPNTPVKCPGAPQKAAYIADDFLRKQKKRSDAHVIYTTSLPVLFGVKKYADALWKVVEARDIDVRLRHNLVAIEPATRIATFEDLDKPSDTLCIDYEMLHVTPPMSAPSQLRAARSLVNDAGFVDVDKGTMQSTRFPNVFAIGDCAGTPNSKTAAAVAAQSNVVAANMAAVMNGSAPSAVYNGYASCPLVTGYEKCILAEFDYNLAPLETFPFNQAQELRTMYLLKKDVMPHIYWLMLRGYWAGPSTLRRLLRLGSA